jgi:hypothetical protein
VVVFCSDPEMQSPEGSRPWGFYFRLHPLMPGERGGEHTSDNWVIHCCDRWIVFVRQGAEEGNEACTNFCTTDRVIRV